METLSTRLKIGKRGRRRLSLLPMMLLALLCSSSMLNAQTYCTPVYSYGCGVGDDLNSFVLNGSSGSISDLNTGCTSNNGTAYNVRFPAIGTVNLAQGLTYSGSVLTSYSCCEYYSIWIDFNNDGVFNQTNERLVNGVGPIANTAASPFTITIPLTAPTGNHRMRVRVNYASSTIDPCTSQTYGETHDYMTNIFALSPCTGAPVAGTISPSGTQTVCPGSSVTITASGYTLASNLNFQWMQSTNGGTTWVPVVGGSGANTATYTTGSINANIRYHLVISCINSGISDSTANVIYNVTSGPVYAPLPFSESFENWSSRCGTSDIPSTSWTNIPFTGNASWRREDQGSTASWTNATSGVYTPSFKVGSHSARLHTYGAPGVAGTGKLSLHVDCSTPGAKELQFWLRTDPGVSYPQDSVYVDTSTDGGATFGVLARYGAGTGGWDFKTLTLNSNSATTIVRFRAWQNYMYSGYTDIYLDGVKILPPCSGKPTAGTINPVNPCSGQNFTLSLTGTTASAGLGYTWQFMPQGGTVWTNLAGGNVASPTANITVPTYFRAIVNCTNGTPADVDTSAPVLATLAPFYMCYCAGYFGGPSYWTYPYVNISNVTIRTQPANVVLLNNGNPVPITNNPNYPPNGYTNYRSVPAPTLIRDSTYKLLVSESSYTSWVYNGYVAAWIDFDRDGVFSNTGGERVMVNQAILSSASPITSINFTVPSGANIGLTGMRIAMNYTSLANPSPCGQIQPYYGEVEDYLVYIDYPPCTGPVNAGTAWISDTAVCPGYSIDLGDTTYEKQRTNISRMWQSTNNGGAVWVNIPGSANKDTVNNVLVTGASMYRLRTVCTKTGDTTYSNVLNVSIPDPVRCYPYSQAMGGSANDSSDIGAVVIGSIVNPVAGAAAGPHLNNPLATRRRTDYTLLQGIELFADSTYRLSVFQTMPRGTHSDAMVSVFMDFNNDLQYNVGAATPPFTDERVFQGITRFDSFYLDTKIKIPSAVIPNVPTGMRVVINNDLNPNAAGNSGIGGFVSGEVEDYVIMFRRAGLGVKPGAGILQNLSLYPNPTEGKFTVLCDAGSTVKHLDVVVSTITGQQVITRSFDNVGVHFTTDLDLSREAKGIYFVEVRADGEKITRKLIVR